MFVLFVQDIRAFFGGVPSRAAGKSKENGSRSKATGKGKTKTPEKNGKDAKSPKDSAREKTNTKGRRKSKVHIRYTVCNIEYMAGSGISFSRGGKKS